MQTGIGNMMESWPNKKTAFVAAFYVICPRQIAGFQRALSSTYVKNDRLSARK